MEASNQFDHFFSADIDLTNLPVKNLAELIFTDLPNRNEDSEIILSHDENELISISLKQLRYIVFSLITKFKEKGMIKDDTILLACISGNNELFTALTFLALSSFGVRVFLPMYFEKGSFEEWIDVANCKSIILPASEINSLDHHHYEKSIVQNLLITAGKRDITCYDLFEDFNLHELIYNKGSDIDFLNKPIIQEAIKNTANDSEALLITTSGSSGKSKIVVYEQGSFINSCLSWQQAGFYDPEKLGGRGFTPLFTHTMGIRAFFNSLWTGVPVCLIKTEWFHEKPEIVRYFFMQMKPEHLTGGPSVYNLLLEFIRNFPELRSSLKENFKTLISSGCDNNEDTVAAVESNFDLKMYNAFGTTESQQVLSTLMYKQPSPDDLKSLGLPLPGVQIGLKRIKGSKDYFKLFINSEFGMKGILAKDVSEKNGPEGFFDTGDIVTLDDNNRIIYFGRESEDFIKDGFGVKVPLNSIKINYKEICSKSNHIEIYPLKSSPGLTALIFIDDDAIEKGLVTDKIVKKKFSVLLGSANNRLKNGLDPFEIRHHLISRFVIANSEVPATVKGNPSQFLIRKTYSGIIDKMVAYLSSDPAIEEVSLTGNDSDLYTRHHNPYFGKMMNAMRMDYSYHKAVGDSMFTYRKGKEIEILDLVGGFGSNLLGHNNENITCAINTFLQKKNIAISDQGSIQLFAGKLADELNSMVSSYTNRNYNVLFGSGGAEAVEIALHHALYEWQEKITDICQNQFHRYGAEAANLLNDVWKKNEKILAKTQVYVVALKDSFHGHSSGSRSLLANREKRDPFKNMLGISPLFIDDTSPEWKKFLEKNIKSKRVKLFEVIQKDKKFIKQEFYLDTVFASIVEPVIGEGGIRIANRECLSGLSDYDFPLIMDEIQSGLGRCGSFLASEGVNADYYLFGKSLGGGVEKISAVLISKKRYKKEFAKYYSSTFANGGLAARVAIEALLLIKDKNIALKAKQAGEKIKDKLKLLRNKYPGIIKEISGTGLMLGIVFYDLSNDPNVFIRNLYIHKHCGLLYSSYLLNNHNIRILPTLSAANVLRVEPSAFISDQEIDLLIKGIDDLAGKIYRKEYYSLFSVLMDDDPFIDNKGKLPEDGFMDTSLAVPSSEAIKVGVLAHFAYPLEEMRILEKEFCKASDTGLRILFNRLQLLLEMKPFVILQRNLYGGKIHFTFITIPVDSAELERLYKQNKRKKVIAKLQEAVDLAAQMNIKVLSLGAYTSILSNNGLALAEPANMKIVTGNTLTAASGIRRLVEEISKNDSGSGSNNLAIIGASGNIGSTITEGILDSDVYLRKIFLIGRNKNKLSKTLAKIKRDMKPEQTPEIVISTNLENLKQSNIIIVASNTNDPLVFPHHISQNEPVIISDLSIPAAVSKEVALMENVINIPFASYIKLPEDENFIISSHTPKGAVFCCAAEAILYGLEPFNLRLKGKIERCGMRTITQLAEKYGFFDNLGAVKTYKTSN